MKNQGACFICGRLIVPGRSGHFIGRRKAATLYICDRCIKESIKEKEEDEERNEMDSDRGEASSKG